MSCCSAESVTSVEVLATTPTRSEVTPVLGENPIRLGKTTLGQSVYNEGGTRYDVIIHS